MKQNNWEMVLDALKKEIREGVLAPGDQLPTEDRLVERFQVGRHSVRRAVEALAKEGKLSIEQGRGMFIENAPRLTYSIGKRTRLRRNLVPQGLTVSSQLLGADLIEADREIADALGLRLRSKVVKSHRVTLADEMPIAFGYSCHSAKRFPDFAPRRDLLGSTTEVYKSYGIDDYVRGETTFYSRQSKPEEAKTLKQHIDLPVIVVRAIDTMLDGTPISYSHVIWAAGRVTFTMSNESDD